MPNSENLKTLLDLVAGDKQIIIPIMQRDYAQGRKESEEIREDFLQYLWGHLQENEGPIELDFIYGALNGTRYTILDGQQRLTTLFLLHWYLSKMDNTIEEFQVAFGKNPRSIKFTYETRPSSTEFFSELIVQSLSYQDIVSCGKISESLKNYPWFVDSWANDPSIKSVLNMLDAIHQRFGNCIGQGLYQKLTGGHIKFRFMPLENFGLTDELYIKMNSTGIPLSPFENFKAHLEKYMRTKDPADTVGAFETDQFYLKPLKSDVPMTEYFSFQMDTTWADYFWAKGSNQNFDTKVMNFFHVVFTNVFYENKDNNTWSDFIQANSKKSLPLTCKKYIGQGVITPTAIKQVIIFLDLMAQDGETYLENCKYYMEKDMIDTVFKSGEHTITYRQRLRFYAYFRFLTQYAKYENNKHQFTLTKELFDWMRVVYNLTENTDYDDASKFSRDIRAINSLVEHAKNILEYISKNDILGFPDNNDYQKKEEKLKASLITADNAWYEKIRAVEDHGYLRGQIRFLLDVGEITENCQEHQKYQQELVNFFGIFKQLFDDKGIKKFQDFLFERALLAQGDYLINNSFCTNAGEYTTWNRCFREKTTIIKKLFLKINQNLTVGSSIEAALDRVIPLNSDGCWETQFIRYPKLFEYFHEQYGRFIRKDSDQGFCLLSKERLSSKHWELYSLVFELEFKSQAQFSALAWGEYYTSNTGDEDDQPCVVLCINNTDASLTISYYDENYKILVNKEAIEEPIVGILQNNNFQDYENNPKWMVQTTRLGQDTFNTLKILDEALAKGLETTH